MANSIVAAPAVLAESVIAAIRGRLPSLDGFSKVFTALEGQAGKAVQVPLVGYGTASQFSTGGYLTGDDANLTAATVTLKHFKYSARFSPLDVKSYGAQYLVNAFTPTAAVAIAEAALGEVAALLTSANYSASINTGAALSYAELITAKQTLDTARAGDPRSFVLNPTYANGLLTDSQLIGVLGLQAPVISSGKIGFVAGANSYMWSTLPDNSQSLAGFACGADAIAVAAGLPYSEIPGFDMAVATDDQSGLSIQILMGQEQSGYYNVTATLLFGAAVGRATSLVRLTTA
jgi:hypothetical protein